MDEHQTAGDELGDAKKASPPVQTIDAALAVLTGRFEGNSRGDATLITGGGRGRLFVEDDGGGPVGAAARMAVVHPMAVTREASVVFNPAQGAQGRIVAKVMVELDARHVDDIRRHVGDGGGPADRQIAYLARDLTGKTDPKDVMQALLSHYVEHADQLARVFGVGTDGYITNEVRTRIATAFGLVEPPLPPYAVPGFWVFRQGRMDVFSRIAEVNEKGVRFEGDHDFTPPGIVATYTSNMASGPWAEELAKRLGCPFEEFPPHLRRVLDAIAARTGMGSIDFRAAEEAITAEIKRLRAPYSG